MASADVIFTIFYIVFSLCFVFPPSEFVSAGLTIPTLCSSWLGSENEMFVQYHIRRSAATMLIHSFIPLCYVAGLYCAGEAGGWSFLLLGSLLWRLFVLASVAVPLAALALVGAWRHGRWKPHPIAQALAAFSNQSPPDWAAVASDINAEYRSVDKFCVATSSVVRVVATANWLVKVTPYALAVAHQGDCALVLSSSDTHEVSLGGPGPAQFLNIEVKATSARSRSFTIRLNAADFRDLQDRVSRPIAVLRDVVFHPTLMDRFLATFRDVVQQNPVFPAAEEPEVCIGCMQRPAEVKLQKMCAGAEVTRSEPCVPCYCRPMWCLDCMGKWFASRQDQERPGGWLGAQCTCPMCRNRFCVLDVCPLAPASRG
ncbi:E3 ubiquitin-protein ligase TM129 [Bacillus rossius redtenbacheri]|uniref:E3 ubiquitin-protein ligase TM129 n=1 Tax=Bacillus rossius redtenbacheri TaxID=93214 RepID=UPI002FDCE6C7